MYQRPQSTNKNFMTQYFGAMRISDAAHILAFHTTTTSVVINHPRRPHRDTQSNQRHACAVRFMVLREIFLFYYVAIFVMRNHQWGANKRKQIS
jgi:hypothetical protein